MLQPVYARAQETLMERGWIMDEMAVDIVRKLDYGFVQDAQNNSRNNAGIVAGTILLDRMVTEFLQQYPDTVVINPGCGLDTRCIRLEGKYRHWYDLDTEERMQIRGRFMEETEKITQIRCDIPDPSWIDRISPTYTEALVIIQCLNCFAKEGDLERFLSMLAQRFEKVSIMIETDKENMPKIRISDFENIEYREVAEQMKAILSDDEIRFLQELGSGIRVLRK